MHKAFVVSTSNKNGGLETGGGKTPSISEYTATMGLLTILKKIKRKEKEIRILILGLDNAGKTTVVKRFCGEPIDTIEPTLGFQIHSLEYRDYTLNLWDVGGQKSIRAYWRNYFEQTDGIIWVVDSVDIHRLTLCRDELSEVLKQERLTGASLLVMANKQDVSGASTVDKVAEALNLTKAGGNQLLENRHWCLKPCSAAEGSGMTEAIDWLVDDISSRIYLLD